MQNNYLQCFHDVIPMGRSAWIRPVTIRLISNVFSSMYLFFVPSYCCTDMYYYRYGDILHRMENANFGALWENKAFRLQ